MDFTKFVNIIFSIISLMPPLWVSVAFVVLTVLIVLAVKRIFF